MKKMLVCLSVLLLSTPAMAETFRINGGGAATSAIFQAYHESFEETTGDVLVVKSTTPADGLIALLKGEADVATAAMSYEELFYQVEKRGIKIDEDSLLISGIGSTNTLVYTHRKNPVKALSKQQLKDIFTGRVTNWRDVGGDDLPVMVVWGKDTPGQNTQFIYQIMDGERVTRSARQATDYANIRKVVSENPGAIGIDPQGFKVAMVRTPQVPSIPRPIIAITRKDASKKVKDMIEFMRMTFEALTTGK